MKFRRFGHSGLMAPVLCLGTGTFSGKDSGSSWGNTDTSEARQIVDYCLGEGLNFFDTANIYSYGVSEEILGQALKGRRKDALIASKASFPMGTGA